jgi:hypothetical protein
MVHRLKSIDMPLGDHGVALLVGDEVVGPGPFGRPQGHLTGRASTGGEVAFGQEAAGDVTQEHAVPPE